MTTPFTGGCACGAVRYAISDEPIFANHCQCRDCQRISGTAHGSYMTFPRREGVKVEGQARRWDIVADSGNTKTHAFCETCGVPVYLTFEAMPDLFAVHAASLDDPSRFRPHAITYASRAHDWAPLDRALPRFETMPTT